MQEIPDLVHGDELVELSQDTAVLRVVNGIEDPGGVVGFGGGVSGVCLQFFIIQSERVAPGHELLPGFAGGGDFLTACLFVGFFRAVGVIVIGPAAQEIEGGEAVFGGFQGGDHFEDGGEVVRADIARVSGLQTGHAVVDLAFSAQDVLN